MILAVAFAAACDVAEAVDTLKAAGKRDAYDCVRTADEARSPLVSAIIADPTNARLTRALALWLLERGDTAWDPDLVTRLPATDRRLLADGVRARRGRQTPSPDHARVFSELPWYHPTPAYNDGKLTPVDRENIRLADEPPPLSVSAPTTAPAAPHAGSDAPCGCAHTPVGTLPLLFLFWRSRARIHRPL